MKSLVVLACWLFVPAAGFAKGALVSRDAHYTALQLDKPTRVYLNKDVWKPGISYFRNDELVVSGPLFGEDKRPVGGYIQNGRLHQPFVEPASGGGNFADTNGVIGQMDDGRFFIAHYQQWKQQNVQTRKVKWAFQNGPILLKDGHIPHSKTTKRRDIQRAAIGYKDDALVVVFSTAPSNMHDLGRFLKAQGCKGGMYLDGTNVGFIDDEKLTGTIVNRSTTLHLQH